MKKKIAFLLAAGLVLSALTGCNLFPNPFDSQPAPSLNMDGTEPTVAPETVAPTEATEAPAAITEATTEATTAPTEAQRIPMHEVPYTTNISEGTAIYAQPNSSSSYVRAVEASGIFTIVEEAYDAQNNLWGKLKSGAGWVQLSVGNSPISHPASSHLPYTVSLSGATLIYAEPSYGSRIVDTVGQNGTYTIVAETYDVNAKLWGKLKSGAGWVCLSDPVSNTDSGLSSKLR